jgi:hypothetical protein
MHIRRSARLSSQRRIDRLVVFLLEARDHFGGGHDAVDAADALA